MPDVFENPQYAPRPSDAERAQRLSLIGLTPNDVKAPPIVVKTGQHFSFTTQNPGANLWIKPLPVPQSLEQLKEMVGVPNRVFEHNNTKHLCAFPESANMPLSEGDQFALTDQNSSAYKTAMNLAYGYADPAYVAQPAVQQLTQVMMAALDGQNAVVGSDLVVEAGATVDLGPNPLVQFDRIIIHGNGQIKVHSNQKVVAGVVQWLPN